FLLMVADRSGPAAAGPLLAELRWNSIRTGLPQLAAAVHIYTAQLEAMRGFVHTARRHLHLGLGALAGAPNIWLESIAEIAHVGICLAASDIDGAFQHAERCANLSEKSGAALIQRAAFGNLSTLSY